MRNQKITASYLADCEEMLDQLSKALREKATDYILTNTLEYYYWQSRAEETYRLSAMISTAKDSELKNERKNA
jgi:hypothetical protein